MAWSFVFSVQLFHLLTVQHELAKIVAIIKFSTTTHSLNSVSLANQKLFLISISKAVRHAPSTVLHAKIVTTRIKSNALLVPRTTLLIVNQPSGLDADLTVQQTKLLTIQPTNVSSVHSQLSCLMEPVSLALVAVVAVYRPLLLSRSNAPHAKTPLLFWINQLNSVVHHALLSNIIIGMISHAKLAPM